jgi:hypothetical protein
METTEPAGATNARRRIVLIAALAALAGTACGPSPSDDAPASDAASTRASTPSSAAGATKEGRAIVLVMVVAKAGGAAIKGAQVVVGPTGDASRSSTFATDARGVAAVEVPDAPDAELVVRADGYGKERRMVERDSGDLIVALRRVDRPAKVSVRLTSPTPVNDVGIAVDWSDVAHGSVAAFDDVESGRRRVTATGGTTDSGWEVVRFVDVAAGRETAVDLAFDPAPRVTGRVVDVEQRPIEGCIVMFTSEATSPAAESRSWGRTDAGGAFSIAGVAADAGTLRVGVPQRPHPTLVRGSDGTWTAVHEESSCVTYETTQATPDETRIVLAEIGDVAYVPIKIHDLAPEGPAVLVTLHRAARITGRLTPAPAGGGRLGVRAFRDGRQEGASSARFDDRGAFACVAPIVGEPLHLWIDVEGFAQIGVDAEAAAPDETRDLGALPLSKGRSIDVAVVDSDGAPCAFRGFDVPASWTTSEHDVTEDDGHVRMDRVPPGPLRIAFAATSSSPRTILAIPDSASAPSRFVVGRGGKVSGRVVGADGKPAAGVEISFHLAAVDDDERESASGRVTTRPDGSYEIVLQSGRLRVGVAEGIRLLDVVPTEITVVDGDAQTLDLRER